VTEDIEGREAEVTDSKRQYYEGRAIIFTFRERIIRIGPQVVLNLVAKRNLSDRAIERTITALCLDYFMQTSASSDELQRRTE
jgi:hypothetical protein